MHLRKRSTNFEDYVVVRIISQYEEFSFDHFLLIIYLKKTITIFKTNFGTLEVLSQCLPHLDEHTHLWRISLKCRLGLGRSG